MPALSPQLRVSVCFSALSLVAFAGMATLEGLYVGGRPAWMIEGKFLIGPIWLISGVAALGAAMAVGAALAGIAGERAGRTLRPAHWGPFAGAIALLLVFLTNFSFRFPWLILVINWVAELRRATWEHGPG